MVGTALANFKSESRISCGLIGSSILNLRKKESLMKNFLKILALTIVLLLLIPGLSSAIPDYNSVFDPSDIFEGDFDVSTFVIPDSGGGTLDVAYVYQQTILTDTTWTYQYRVYNPGFKPYWFVRDAAITLFVLQTVQLDAIDSWIKPDGINYTLGAPDAAGVGSVTFQFESTDDPASDDEGVYVGYISDIFGFVVDNYGPDASESFVQDGSAPVKLLADANDAVITPQMLGTGDANVIENGPGVPEPGTVLLVGSGLLGLAVFIRKRAK
jgi:hypothetical protein